jgi:hypothetical protein
MKMRTPGRIAAALLSVLSPVVCSGSPRPTPGYCSQLLERLLRAGKLFEVSGGQHTNVNVPQLDWSRRKPR